MLRCLLAAAVYGGALPFLMVEREKQRSIGGEKEKMGRKEKRGPSNGNKLGPTRIQSGFESGLD